MLVCDRCNKQASQSRNLLPAQGTALCDSCAMILDTALGAFVAGQAFSVDVADMAPAIAISDPAVAESAVQVKG